MILLQGRKASLLNPFNEYHWDQQMVEFSDLAAPYSEEHWIITGHSVDYVTKNEALNEVAHLRIKANYYSLLHLELPIIH